MKIGFHGIHCGIRGTTNSCFDYATYAQEILGYEAVMLWAKNYDGMEHPRMFQMIKDSSIDYFKVDHYEDTKELDKVCKDLGLDILYIIKSGDNDGVVSSVCPTAIHAVFGPHATGQHGQSWAYVSKFLSDRHGGSPAVPYVPHMIVLPEPLNDIRKDWGIPADARVIGRHGGYTQFDCGHAHQAVDDVLEQSDDIWFLFLNTQRFGRAHPRKIFLPASADRQFKADYVEASDAMLHARTEGETFGIACGEFSIRNKPIFMMERQQAWHHLSVLTEPSGKTNCYRFGSREELTKQLLAFDPGQAKTGTWDAYKQFTPDKVMPIFNKIFIQGAMP